MLKVSSSCFYRWLVSPESPGEQRRKKRTVNIEQWAEEGERLFDRMDSAFKGKGTLKQHAEEALLPAWENGSDADVLAAMKKFQENHANELITNAKVAKTDKENFNGRCNLLNGYMELAISVLFMA